MCNKTFSFAFLLQKLFIIIIEILGNADEENEETEYNWSHHLEIYAFCLSRPFPISTQIYIHNIWYIIYKHLSKNGTTFCEHLFETRSSM